MSTDTNITRRILFLLSEQGLKKMVRNIKIIILPFANFYGTRTMLNRSRKIQLAKEWHKNNNSTS